MRHGLTMPLFGALADLVAFGDIAEAADEAGLDGVFVWDHVLSPVEGQWAIADPWIALAAAATRSRQIRIGPMVTPLPRRRLINVSQATQSLDQLSGGTGDSRTRSRQRPGSGALGLRRAR
ncbi:MAG: LLM class flavin-dependent oxidoreductase [bacterium]|nr:LLM class flavin-dependent oxidoreductase [bacterium]